MSRSTRVAPGSGTAARRSGRGSHALTMMLYCAAAMTLRRTSVTSRSGPMITRFDLVLRTMSRSCSTDVQSTATSGSRFMTGRDAAFACLWDSSWTGSFKARPPSCRPECMSHNGRALSGRRPIAPREISLGPCHRLGLIEPALKDRVLHDVDAAAQIEFAHGVALVRVHRLGAERQLRTDFLVAVARRNQ